jgi:hypothetical protein
MNPIRKDSNTDLQNLWFLQTRESIENLSKEIRIVNKAIGSLESRIAVLEAFVRRSLPPPPNKSLREIDWILLAKVIGTIIAGAGLGIGGYNIIQ